MTCHFLLQRWRMSCILFFSFFFFLNLKLCPKSHTSASMFIFIIIYCYYYLFAVHFSAVHLLCGALNLTWVSLSRIVHCRFAPEVALFFFFFPFLTTATTSSTMFNVELQTHGKDVIDNLLLAGTPTTLQHFRCVTKMAFAECFFFCFRTVLPCMNALDSNDVHLRV